MIDVNGFINSILITFTFFLYDILLESPGFFLS